MTSVAVCIACHNRKDRTLACLGRLLASTTAPEITLRVHVLDDASSDGSAEAIRQAFPDVLVHAGDGTLFWAGGMRVAYGAALREKHDFYLWLNDDVELFPDALQRALDTYTRLKGSHGGEHIVVGAMRAPDSLRTTYSGYRRASPIFTWKFQMVEPNLNEATECATVNGNFLLIPSAVADVAGNIPEAFTHTLGDFDFGLRARKAGVRSWVMPGYAGVCEANTTGRSNFKAPGLRFRERLAKMEHPLGHPLRPSLAYARNFGLWAPAVVLAPYVGLLRATFSRRR
ncbi:glycosyltransferase family 2 protein [Chthonobacter albigriseus]|uniref:glycosyltransferase family 2 protein n=1 Tax=Chthonobacter albigriseus TaxID=1683161 RepID=UPI0015EF44FB|nr:glycosyltransferase family 2 protein [Chthonobacter albigriseus]